MIVQSLNVMLHRVLSNKLPKPFQGLSDSLGEHKFVTEMIRIEPFYNSIKLIKLNNFTFCLVEKITPKTIVLLPSPTINSFLS